MQKILGWLALVGALVSLTGTANAQSAPPPTELVAPRLVNESPASYPTEAARAHLREAISVTVLLDIDATGQVRGVTVTQPQGLGFDESAIAAAKKLTFEPARRAGTPIASRISFRFVFQPLPTYLAGRALINATGEPIEGATILVKETSGKEHRTLSGADGVWNIRGLPPGPVHVVVSVPGFTPVENDETLENGEETSVVTRLIPAQDGKKPATQGPGEPPSEIVVHGERAPREVTKRTLTKDEIEHLPGTNGDALRAIQNLPGVARPPPFSGQLVVRGSAPQDTTIFVDGVDVPLVYHFGGLSSVIPTELLEKIDFYPANYGAVYGRGTGGMVDVRLRSPRGDRFHGLAQADFIDARLMAEGPIGSTGFKYLVAARRSYFDVWLKPLLEGAAGPVTTAPRYYDYQLMLEKDLGSRASLQLSIFGSDDALQILNQSPSASTPTFAGSIGAHTSFWRAQLRYENKLAEHTKLRVMGSVGHDSIDFGIGPNFFTVDQKPINSRVELTQRVARGIQANVGLDVVVAPYDIALRLPPPRRPGESFGGPLDVPQQTHTTGSRTLPAFYTEWELLPTPGTRLVPSLRADYTNTTRSWDVAPRVSARQDITRDYPRSTLKGGVGLYFQPPTPVDTDPTYGQKGLKTSRAVHYDVGVEQDLSRRVRASVDVFYKSLDRLIVPGSGNSGTGRVYGAEWLVKYDPDERFFGWIAYTLSRSERRDTPDTPRRLFEFDQTHVLTLVGSYKLGRGWQIGARFRLVSGGLYTPEREGPLNATAGVNQSAPDFPRFAARLPAFHQLDLRVDKSWTFERWKLSFYADIQNVYYRQNPEGISYNYNFTKSTYVNGLPILPSLGLRGEL